MEGGFIGTIKAIRDGTKKQDYNLTLNPKQWQSTIMLQKMFKLVT